MKRRLLSPVLRALGWAAAGAMLLSMAGCAHLGTRGGVPKELRVGIAPNYPPMAFKHDGRLQGVEPDFAERLGKQLGVQISLVETTFDELIPGLLAKRYDVIMSGFSVTPERQQQVAFTESYLTIGQMAVVRAADYDRLHQPGAVNQPATRIGVVSGTTGAAFAHAKLSQAAIKPYPSVDDAVLGLRRGEVDVFIHDAPAIWNVRGRPLFADQQLKGVYRPLTTEPLAWAVRKEDGALLQRLNQTLAEWQQTGVVDEVLAYWMPVRKVTVDAK
jgi:polar amino acid transport system substrate-binding protein